MSIKRAVVFLVRLALFSFVALAARTAPLWAQNTTNVTGCITDPNGIKYTGGQISGVTNPASQNSFGATPLDSNACFTQTIASPFTWIFTVNNPGAAPPVGFGPVSFTCSIAISGASQTITTQLDACAIPLLQVGSGSSTFNCTGASVPEILWLSAPHTCSGIAGSSVLAGGEVTLAPPGTGSTSLTVDGDSAGDDAIDAACNSGTAGTACIFENVSATTTNAIGNEANTAVSDSAGASLLSEGLIGSGVISGTNVASDLAEGVKGFGFDISTGGAAEEAVGVFAQILCTSRTVLCYGIDVLSPHAGSVAGVHNAAINIRTQGGNSAITTVTTDPSTFGPLSSPDFILSALCIASGASPVSCGSDTGGFVTVQAGSTSVTVDTSGITADAIIIPQFDASLGTALGVTCNTTVDLPTITARVTGTSFTITVPAAPATNPACISFLIVNH
jgi:hypothetical protein